MSTVNDLRQDLYGEKFDTSAFVISKMVGTSLPWAKIRTPQVKEVFKKYKKDETLDLTTLPLRESVEMTLMFFLLSLSRLSTFNEQMSFLRKNLRYADSWMITDTLSQVIKKASDKDFQPYYREFSHSDEEYKKRFAYVYAMKYYHEDACAFFLNGLVYDDAYYVYMAQAWMLATFAICHFDEIHAFLLRDDIPATLKRKTISKMRDSYRITDEEKEIIKKIRDKI